MQRLLTLVAILAAAIAGARAGPYEDRLPTCLACHGENGTSTTSGVPSLGGQPADFVLIQLFLFRSKQRDIEPMTSMADGLSDADLQRFGDTMAKLAPPAPPDASADAARMERGAALAAQNRCGFCHNPDFSGRDQIPRIAAQREDYLAKALRDYKSGARVGYEPTMLEVMRPLDDTQIADLAYYLARVSGRPRY
jgi:cytochrome c553